MTNTNVRGSDRAAFERGTCGPRGGRRHTERGYSAIGPEPKARRPKPPKPDQSRLRGQRRRCGAEQSKARRGAQRGLASSSRCRQLTTRPWGLSLGQAVTTGGRSPSAAAASRATITMVDTARPQRKMVLPPSPRALDALRCATRRGRQGGRGGAGTSLHSIASSPSPPHPRCATPPPRPHPDEVTATPTPDWAARESKQERRDAKRGKVMKREGRGMGRKAVRLTTRKAAGRLAVLFKPQFEQSWKKERA